MIPFRIRGLDPRLFSQLVGLNDEALRAHNARRVIADSHPGYPDRVELRDAAPGESLLLVNYVHQPVASPYRASHAVYVLEHANQAYDVPDSIPELLRSRVISLRAFDEEGMLVGTELCPGDQLEPLVDLLLSQPSTAYLHLHFAKPGCFACRVDRA